MMTRWTRKNKTFLRYVLLVVFSLLVVLYIFYGASGLSNVHEHISYTVTRLSGANGWNVYVVEDNVRRDLLYEDGAFCGLAYEGQTYYMERTFTGADLFPAADGTTKAATFYARTLWGHLSVFLDGVLAFTDSPEQPADIGEITFDRAYPENLESARAHYYGSLAALRLTDYAGVTVTIAQNEIGTGMGDSLYTCDAYIRTTDADADRYIFTTFIHLMPPMILLVIGLTLIILFLYQVYHAQQRVRLFFLALYALLWAVNMYMEMPFYPYELPWRISLYGWSPWYFYIIPLLIYLCLSMRRCRVPIVILLVLYTGTAALEYAGILQPEVSDDLVLVTCLALLITVEWSAGHSGRIAMGVVLTLALFALSAYYIATHAVWGAYSWHTLRLAYGCTQWLYALHALLFACCVFVEVRGVIRMAMRKGNELQMLRAREQLAVESYTQMASYTEAIAHVRHDIRNHLLVMRTFLDDGQPERTRTYLADMLHQDAAVGQIVRTGNFLIDTVLGGKLSEARRLDIPVAFAEVSDPGPLAIPENELASVLMNILDNAIEASCRIRDPAHRHIVLRMHAKDPYGFFSCENAVEEAPILQDGRLLSTKGDGKLHGYGMDIIQKTVAASDGLVAFQIEPDSFLIKVLIPLRGA